MPQTLIHFTPAPAPRLRHRCAGPISIMAVVVGCMIFFFGCTPAERTDQVVAHAERLFPRPPQPTAVVALGDLHAGALPSEGQVRLAVFLFGEEPTPATLLLKPAAIAVSPNDGALLVTDSFLPGLFVRHDARHGLEEWRIPVDNFMPGAACAARDGGWLIVDLRAGRILRVEKSGAIRHHLSLGEKPFRPSGVVEIGDDVWCSNVAAHTIEVFDGQSGAHRRTLGRRGNGPGEFAYPMGMAVSPGGDLYVVDMINYRVQVLRSSGEWVRDVGRAGDCVGCFSRPKDVAVGPDGTVFVTDALTGRVHVFDERGRALLAFGESDSGVGSLVMPAGIACVKANPLPDSRLPGGFVPDYFVLVAEQMLEPSIRVYAWRKPDVMPIRAIPAGLPNSAIHAGALDKTPFATKVENPHWNASRCDACHDMNNAIPSPIARAEVDAVCVSCHDGRKARDEAHSVGRLAAAAHVNTPDDWPTIEGRIGCITCHNIREHCDVRAVRPVQNPMLLRGYEPDRADQYCHTCHRDEEADRFSPHRQLAADGRPNEQSCLFCHDRAMTVPADGIRTGHTALRAAASQACLTCHVRHWDVSLRGHVDRPMTTEVRSRMLQMERVAQSDKTSVARPVIDRADAANPPQRLPLAGDLVTCFTCHNPHQQGLFPPDSDLGRISRRTEDAHAALRLGQDRLCFECHSK